MTKIKHSKLNQIKKPSILDFYGAGKRPNQKHHTIKEEHEAFMKAVGENAAKEGLLGKN